MPSLKKKNAAKKQNMKQKQVKNKPAFFFS
jgi:hypothetical protein